METKYNEQAEKFLVDTNTTLEIVKAVPQKSPLWASTKNILAIDHGINYYCILKNPKHTFGFDYWGSIADAEKIRHGEGHGTKPSAYDILACLGVNMGDVNFDEFCDNFGYDTDSITAEKTFKACKEEYRNLVLLFNQSELEKLSEIQ